MDLGGRLCMGQRMLNLPTPIPTFPLKGAFPLFGPTPQVHLGRRYFHYSNFSRNARATGASPCSDKSSSTTFGAAS